MIQSQAALKPPQRSNPTTLAFAAVRPFYWAALCLALVATLLWVVMYDFRLPLLREDYPALSWHMHEMVFGFGGALLIGFLFAAVQRSSGQADLSGTPLVGLVLLWLLTRLLPFVPALPLWFFVLQEGLFWLVLVIALALPLFSSEAKNCPWWVLGLFALLIPANLLFYLGLMAIWQPGLIVGVYAGLYLLLGMLLLLGQRTITTQPSALPKRYLDRQREASVDNMLAFGYVLFVASQLYTLATGSVIAGFLAALLGLILFILHGVRLLNWYHARIWQDTARWMWYLGYAWLGVGFLLQFLSQAFYLDPWAGLHIFAYGGLGFMSLGMVARGWLQIDAHSTPLPFVLSFAYWLLLAAVFMRLLGLVIPDEDGILSLAIQLLWGMAFALLLSQYKALFGKLEFVASR